MTSIIALPGITIPSNASERQALIDTVTALVEIKLATTEGSRVVKVTIISIGGVSVLQRRLMRPHLGRKLRNGLEDVEFRVEFEYKCRRDCADVESDLLKQILSLTPVPTVCKLCCQRGYSQRIEASHYYKFYPLQPLPTSLPTLSPSQNPTKVCKTFHGS